MSTTNKKKSRLPKFDGTDRFIAHITMRNGESSAVLCHSEAERMRVARADRERVCRWLGAPIDSCYTMGELVRDLRNEYADKVQQ